MGPFLNPQGLLPPFLNSPSPATHPQIFPHVSTFFSLPSSREFDLLMIGGQSPCLAIPHHILLCRLWYPLSHLHEYTVYGSHSVTQMYRLWYPLSHLHEYTDYGGHSVIQMYRIWYPLRHLHDAPAVGPIQSPLECTVSGFYPVSCIRYRL